MRRWALPLLLIALPVACYRPPLAAAGPEGCGTAPGRGVLAAVNEARAGRGLPELVMDERLGGAAGRHSQDMARHRFLDHTGYGGSTFGERARDAGYHGPVGEVVAAGYRTPAEVVEGWLRSRRHRDILLLPTALHLGAGCAPSSRGALFWTAVIGGG